MKKKIAVVTGATSGIGRAITHHLITLDYHVVAIGRNEHMLGLLKVKYCNRVSIINGDVRLGNDLKTQLYVTLHNEKIDLLIHSAGILRLKPLNELTPQDAEDCIQTNFMGTVNMVLAVLPYLRTGSQMGIISSVGALTEFPGGFSVYAASKAAITTFCEHCREELKNMGVQLTMIYPSLIDTAMIPPGPLPPVYRAFPRHSPHKAAEGIVNDVLAGRRKSFTTFPDRMYATIARLAPRTFNTVLKWYIKLYK